ncbi:hypothetical protein Leryth_025889, partial [Lithospermum erythrorhizon]
MLKIGSMNQKPRSFGDDQIYSEEELRLKVGAAKGNLLQIMRVIASESVTELPKIHHGTEKHSKRGGTTIQMIKVVGFITFGLLIKQPKKKVYQFSHGLLMGLVFMYPRMVPTTTVIYHHSLIINPCARNFPLILYFNYVNGVNKINSKRGGMNSANRYTWTPLSTDTKRFAQAWIKAYLNLQKKNSLLQCLINGIKHCQPLSISFTVHAPSYKSEYEGLNKKRVSWHEECFYVEETEVKNYNLRDFFHALNLNQDERIGWIGKLTLARLLMAQHSLMSRESLGESSFVHYEEVLQLYNDLTDIDPSHSQYYKDHYSLVLLKQALSDNGFVQKYCRRYRDSTSPINDWSFCLRLNNLSLTRIGSVEQLLWVQMLDLSQNQLQLKAMQLLSALNLSHNKLSSFTALEPLRLLKSLKVLDISHNEIESERQMSNYWDAYAIFKDLSLIQLDILGNAVADEKLKLLLHKLMPELKWLDACTSTRYGPSVFDVDNSTMTLQYLTLRTLRSALADNPRGQNHFRSIGGLEVLLDGLGISSTSALRLKEF